MTAETWAALVCAVVLGGYLLVALLDPERFG